MKASNRKTASASSRSSGDRGRAASGSKTASNAKAARRQSIRSESNKADDVREPATGVSEKASNRKLRS
jgi:hypothetical protein